VALLYYIKHLTNVKLIDSSESDIRPLLQVYWMPTDSEEKISLSMTVLLAFLVNLFVVNNLTPASSDSTPVIGTQSPL